MALFKVLRGTASSIDRNNANKPPFNDGYAYFTPDDGRFYIDVQLDTPLPANAYYDSGTVNGKTIYRIEIENQPMRELYTAINGKAPIEHHHYMSDINDAVQGVYFVKGTQTAATASWTGNLPTIDALYDGLTIAYYLPASSDNNTTLTLTLKNSTTAAEPVYWTGTSRMTTHYGAGSVILLTWVSNATSGYAAVGSASGRWMRADYNTDNIPASLCTTGAGTAAKTASHSYYTAKPNSYTLVTMRYANTAASALTLNINGQGAKPIYINGVASSATNYTLPAGTYFVFYDGTNYYFNTDGEIPNVAESIGKPDDWTWDKSKVSYSANVTSGTQLGTIIIDGNENAKIYAPNYTGSSPISVNASTKAISHNTSGVTADTYGTTATTGVDTNFGGSFTVPGFTVNNTGHITAAGEHNINLPSLAYSSTKTSGKELGKININGNENNVIYDTRDIWYATCPTEAATAAKVVTTTNGDFILETGSTVFIKFTYANTSTSATLNIDGKGAKAIKAYGTTAPTGSTWAAGAVVRFTYDGTNFIQENGQIASTSVYGITKLSSATNSTSTSLAATASAVKSAYDLASSKSTVSYSATQTSGTQLGTIVINGNESAKIYAPNYTGSSPISVNTTTKAISHNTSGVTADTYGVIEQDDISVSFGGNFIVPGFTVNGTGHITAAEDHKIILPSLSVSQNLTSGTKVGTIDVNGRAVDFYAPTNTNTTYTLSKTGNVLTLTPSSGTAQEVTLNVASSSADGLMTIADKQKLDAISSGATAVSYSPTVSSGTELGTIVIDGNENAKIYSPKYTADAPISVSNAFKITHATSGPSTTGDTSKGDTTNKEPAFGATFKVLSATVNKYGHTTALGEHTVKIPSLSNSPKYGSTQGFLIDTLTINGQESNIYIPSYPTIETLGLSKALKFIGFATTSITDGSTADPGISGYSTKTTGDVIIDANSHYEYVWTTSNKWERLGGDNSYALSGLEYDVTNGGTNAKSAVTISPKTATIHPIKTLGTFARGTSASLLMNVTNEKLTFTFDTNTPSGYETAPELDTDITVWTGYNTGANNTYAAAQTFTPTTKKITLS